MKITTVCIIAALVGWYRAALSITILDQSQGDFSSGEFVHGTVSVAQTFTPSVSGSLAQLNLFMSNHDTAEGLPLVVSIYNTQGGVPNSSLGTIDLNNIGSYYNWYALDFSSLDISLNANTLYAFVLSCPGSFFGIYPGGSVNPYSYTRGMALIQGDVGASWQPDTRAPQLTFATYMTVPEPCSTVLILLACGVFGSRRFHFGA